MVVVKADAYGHGMAACAREARVAGATWLGVATPTEALALRAAGDAGPAALLALRPDRGPEPAGRGRRRRLGLQRRGRLPPHRGGRRRRTGGPGPPQGRHRPDAQRGARSTPGTELFAAAAEAEEAGALRLVGLWSHLAAADEPGHPSVALQLAAFDRAYAAARLAGRAAGAAPPRQLRRRPRACREARFDLVRVGIAAYGIEPAPGLAALAGVTLTPVMRLRAQLALVKAIDAGTGVSYGWTWTAPGRHGRRAGPAGLRRRRPAARRERRRGRGRAAAACPSADGSAWTSSWSSSGRARGRSRATR